MAQRLAELWETECTSIHNFTIFDQQDDCSCGTVALAHLGHVLNLWPDNYHPDTTAWHHQVREAHPTTTHMHVARGPPQLALDNTLPSLSNLLIEKGVPPALAGDRAAAATKQLGTQPITDAMRSKNPWSVLKSLGNKPAHPFLWVKPEELMVKIQQRATTQYGISTSNKKKTRDSTDTQRDRPDPQLDPSELQLIPNTFVGEDGIPVEHLHISSVGKGKTGIAFTTIHQAMPYLQGAEQLSAGPLAILTTTPAPSISTLVAENLMYPAMHANTLEPLLIHGSLIQLGKVLITRLGNLPTWPQLAPTQSSSRSTKTYGRETGKSSSRAP